VEKSPDGIGGKRVEKSCGREEDLGTVQKKNSRSQGFRGKTAGGNRREKKPAAGDSRTLLQRREGRTL